MVSALSWLLGKVPVRFLTAQSRSEGTSSSTVPPSAIPGLSGEEGRC